MDLDNPDFENSSEAVEDPEIVAGPSSLKRPAADDASGNPSKKLKRSSRQEDFLENGTKNAIMLLNEFVPGLQYTIISQWGQVHSPTFTMKVEYYGKTFLGRGGTKKEAKLKAAESVMSSIRERPAEAFPDSTESISSSSGVVNPGMSYWNGITNDVERRNPVSLLNERKPDLRYEVVSEIGQSHCKMFVMSVTVEGKVFFGTGQSKKMAKARAARAAVETIYGLTFPADPAMEEVPLKSDESPPHYRTLGDFIAEMILGKFAELTNQYTAPNSRYKVISGVVLTTDDVDPSSARLISLATGSKCINGDFMSITGKTLNDLHAEILAIRGCRVFILNELDKILSAADGELVETILQRDPTGNGFMMKPNIKLHLFISSSPCGDARIFSPHEPNPDDQEVDRHPNRVVRGQLRMKVESGEGTVPVKSCDGAQTWDGVIDGERLLTMSCSDKIARWNVLGIQGSILSHIMKPVYLDSVVVGRLYHNGHLKRALYGRIDLAKRLPTDYHLNQPLLSPITHPEKRTAQKAPGYACFWMDDGQAMEVIITNSGRLLDGHTSKLSKAELFRRFKEVSANLPDFYPRNKLSLQSTYGEVKSAAKAHQKAKVALYEAFKKAGHGQWVRRPSEQHEFTV